MKKRRIAIALSLEMPWPHHQQVFSGVMTYARQQPNWHCVIDEHPGMRAKQRHRDHEQYDGVIARAAAPIQRAVKRMAVPMVNVQYEHHKPGIATVATDPEAVGRLAAEHLLSRGYRRFGVLTGGHGKGRKKIVSTFIKQIELDERSCWVETFPYGDTTDVNYWIRLESCLQHCLTRLQPPTALFVESPIIARLLTEMGSDLGFKVPQDIAILCDVINPVMAEVGTQLSAIGKNYEQLGYEAAELLDRLIDGENIPEKPILVPPGNIVARASTDYFAVEDELVAKALRYISAHLDAKITVETIAYDLAVSPKTLYSRFHAAMGHGVGAEIRRLRLAAAKIMLADKDVSIASIAAKVGFASPAIFSRTFLREFGMTPSNYRKSKLHSNQ